MDMADHIDREPAMTLQIKELDDALNDCIQRFRDETTGMGVRVLIAEFEELMVLRVELLTQMVIADQRVKHVCRRFGYEPRPTKSFLQGLTKKISLGEMDENKGVEIPPTKNDRAKKNLFLSATALVISIVGLIIRIAELL